MKKVFALGVVLSVLGGDFLCADRTTVDKIIARVNGALILQSDLQMPRIEKNGDKDSLDELIERELLVQKAVERKALPGEEEVNRKVIAQREISGGKSMTELEFDKELRKVGLSVKKYKDQLARIIAAQKVRQMEISERVVVTNREIEDLYAEQPEYTQDRYLLKTAIIPFSEASDEKTAEKLMKKEKHFEWVDVDWVDKSEISDQMAFLHSMNEGEVSKPVKVAQGFQIVKLMKKEIARQKTLDECRIDFQKKLEKEKRIEFEKQFTQELKNSASIIYLN